MNVKKDYISVKFCVLGKMRIDQTRQPKKKNGRETDQGRGSLHRKPKKIDEGERSEQEKGIKEVDLNLSLSWIK